MEARAGSQSLLGRTVYLGLGTATRSDSPAPGLAGPRALRGSCRRLRCLQSVEGEGFWRKKGKALCGRGPE